jgi:hypothetical protein
VTERNHATDVESVVRALADDFGTAVEVAAIVAQVEVEFATYRDARVTEFVPLLVTRRVRTKLGAPNGSARRDQGPHDLGAV